MVLPFDDAELAGATVADVLADPARFEGATLADPLEGVAYGACKAKIMVRADGMPWIHSFAHGRSVYELKLDARAVENALKKAPAAEIASLFVRLALMPISMKPKSKNSSIRRMSDPAPANAPSPQR